MTGAEGEVWPVLPGLAGKSVVVVGGVGSAVVRTLLASEAKVIVVDRDSDRSSALVEAAGGGSVLTTIQADVTLPAGLQAVTHGLDACGRVDGLVNVVGGVDAGGIGHFLDQDASQWRETLERNALYAVQTCQIVARRLVRTGGGSLVNLSFIDGARAAPWFAAYGSARSALDAATRTMAVELGPFNIRANTVSWGLVNSPRMHPDETRMRDEERSRIPVGRRGDAAEVAHAVAFLVSDLASYITGQNIMVDGGLSLKGAHYQGQGNLPAFVQSPDVARRLSTRFRQLADQPRSDGD